MTHSSKLEREERRGFFLFISPWLIGFVLLMLVPMLTSAYISLTRWNLLKPPVFVGLENFKTIFADPLFYKSMRVTFTYTLFAVPLNIVLSVFMAILLNNKIKGMNVYRTLFYLPAVVSGVVIALVWMWMFQPEFGIINNLLSYIGIKGPKWIYDENWAMPSLILMSLWNVGGNIVLYLAALQGVPTEQYEAASIDGARWLDKFLNITLPGISPTLLFTTLTGVINSLQTFTQAYVMTNGGPNESTTFYAYYIYNNAFVYRKMGEASAQGWIMFAIICVISLLIMKTSAGKVYYDGGEEGDLL
ncbi:ABC transporter permease subunit [Beduinella massiliensis]|uniref:ABC transporter permease subunit n=1 Tax=Beduinella massiliensis TaxID=1852363 RepID=UPI000C8227A4